MKQLPDAGQGFSLTPGIYSFMLCQWFASPRAGALH